MVSGIQNQEGGMMEGHFGYMLIRTVASALETAERRTRALRERYIFTGLNREQRVQLKTLHMLVQLKQKRCLIDQAQEDCHALNIGEWRIITAMNAERVPDIY